MKEVKKLDVTHCRLHQSIEILGAGAVGPTINQSNYPGVKMELIPQGLMVQLTNKAGKPCKPTLIPLPNVAALQLAD